MPRAVALFDRVLVASFSPNPVEGLGWAEELVSLGDAWGSASLRAMGLVSVGRALAAEDVDRARTALTEAVTLADASRCGLLVDQAKRVISEIDALAGVHDDGFRGLADLLQGFGHSGDLSQQLQTVVSALDPLVTVDAIEVATVLCGSLSQTALGSAAQCERALALSSDPPLERCVPHGIQPRIRTLTSPAGGHGRRRTGEAGRPRGRPVPHRRLAGGPLSHKL